jgi:hypothetical protein
LEGRSFYEQFYRQMNFDYAVHSVKILLLRSRRRWLK